MSNLEFHTFELNKIEFLKVCKLTCKEKLSISILFILVKARMNRANAKSSRGQSTGEWKLVLIAILVMMLLQNLKKLNSFILLIMVSIGPNMGHFVLIKRMSKDVFLLLKLASRIAF